MKTLKFTGRICFILILLLTFSVTKVIPQVADINDGTIYPQVKESGPAQSRAPIIDPVLWDNGPLVTHTGIGYGGADISILQDASLGMGIYGFGHQYPLGYKVADEFEISNPGGWDITGIAFFAYQTGSATVSPFIGVYFEIYDGDPMLPGSNVIFGDFVTNRLTNSAFANIYRVLESGDLLSNVRPIMENYCAINLSLGAGTYWLVWNTEGSTSYSGPWLPPVTILNMATTGNGLQYTTAWGSLWDTNSSAWQGAPFIIYGNQEGTVIPVAGWSLAIGLLLIIGLALLRYRRII
jgi:hypothetical protein